MLEDVTASDPACLRSSWIQTQVIFTWKVGRWVRKGQEDGVTDRGHSVMELQHQPHPSLLYLL